MNARAIRRLRLKFILISTVTYFLVMLFMGLFINAFNTLLTRNQIRTVLNYLLTEEMSGTGDEDEPERHETVLNEFSAEFRYSARYFSAVLNEKGKIEELKTGHVVTISRDEAAAMAVSAFGGKRKYGRIGTFYYKKGNDEDGNLHIIFLNCASQLSANLRILYITMLIAAAGLLIAFALVYIFSYRVIQPEIENVRRQKQFITNASHELKTPLAVIRANTEIEEMMNGADEWTESTMRQVERLDGLIQNLVMISRAQEKEDRSVMARINAAASVRDTVSPYEALAHQEHKELLLQIPEEAEFVADESKIRQLTSLLVDNAFKYCDENGRITVSLDLMKKGKTLRLICSNSYAEGEKMDYSRFFDRFYREDSSHNVDKGGYGIGLSIAESICQQYGGSIQASWKDGEISFTCLLN